MKRTKIICTLGPSCSDKKTLVEMIGKGMDVARINFSHSDYDHHADTIAALKEAREETGKAVPLMIDTMGPEIRTGKADGEVNLERGDEVEFVYEEKGKCTKERISVSYAGFHEDVSEGAKILIDDGKISAEVTSIEDKKVRAKVVNGGRLKSRKGVNIPGAKIGLPTTTDKDREDIVFAIEQDFDFVAVSFVRSYHNVMEMRQFLDDNGGEDMKIISKIESREGVDNIDDILEISDGIMIARGDLGVEIPYSEVPSAQKSMIKKALSGGKIVITATEMMDSMQSSPVPTRAEVSDVYNAVVQSSTCLMLSGETAAGEYPVRAVEAMSRVISKAEEEIDTDVERPIRDIATSLCSSVVASSRHLDAKCIVAYSESGTTARKISSFRPRTPVLVISPNRRVLRQSHILWGVTPYHKEQGDSTIQEMFSGAEGVAKDAGMAENGDYIVVVAGTPIGVKGSTNTMRISVVGGR